jgi:hypothetical protein
MLPEPIRVTKLVVEVFERLSIPYFIGGSLASAIYGVARSTLDSDLIADLPYEKVESVVDLLGQEFYADAEMIRDAIRRRSSFNLIHMPTMFKVDVFILKQRPYDRTQFNRRVFCVLASDPEVTAYAATPEDIVLAKLEWYRLGGEVSDRQWRDVLGVLKLQSGRVDLEYLQRWAGELGVADLLDRALKEAD